MSWSVQGDVCLSFVKSAKRRVTVTYKSRVAVNFTLEEDENGASVQTAQLTRADGVHFLLDSSTGSLTIRPKERTQTDTVQEVCYSMFVSS